MSNTKTAKQTRTDYLSELKKNLPPAYYFMVIRLLDLKEEYLKDELVELTRRAEQRYLISVKFDPTNVLKGEELARYMELENEERIKFGMEPEWLPATINQAR